MIITTLRNYALGLKPLQASLMYRDGPYGVFDKKKPRVPSEAVRLRPYSTNITASVYALPETRLRLHAWGRRKLQYRFCRQANDCRCTLGVPKGCPTRDLRVPNISRTLPQVSSSYLSDALRSFDEQDYECDPHPENSLSSSITPRIGSNPKCVRLIS